MLNSGSGVTVVCLGDALVDFLPARPGQLLKDAALLRRMAGGATANVTVGLARLGIPAAFLGKVGDDQFGYFLRETLEAHGVDVSQMFTSREAITGMAFAWNDPVSNEARYLFQRGIAAYRLLDITEIDCNWLAKAQVLQYGSVLLSSPPSAEATRAAVQCARASNLLTCYDVNMRLPAWPDHASARADMLSLIEHSAIVKLNRHELAFLTGETDVEKGAAKLWHSDTRLLLVTLDRAGCYYRTSDNAGFVAGFEVKIVDTVGAGDAFMAAFLARLLKNYDPPFDAAFSDQNFLAETCRYANAAGALTVTRPGAIPALPTGRQISRFLKNQDRGQMK
jgi:fructokinase